MKHSIFLFVCWFFLLNIAAYGMKAVFDIKTDRSNAVYKCGEKATFTIRVCDSNQHAITSGVLRVTLSRDNYHVLSSNSFDMCKTSSPFIVSGTLNKPGFMHCSARLTVKGRRGGSSWSSAGFDPEKIQPDTRFPGDFRAWWDGERKKLASVPLDVQLEKIGNFNTNLATGYRLSVVSANDERIYGFLAVPSGPGPFPALVMVPGAGTGFPGPSCQQAYSMQALVLNMNVHKYAVPTNRPVTKQTLKDYLAKKSIDSIFLLGYKDPKTYHFYTIFLGIDRAIDYVLSRPDWDKKTLVVSGSSQGGWLTLVMAGMKNDKVTAATAGVPFVSDMGRLHHHGGSALRKLIAAEGSDATIPYYAGVNFARYVKCPIIMSVGYRDGSCYPSSVYAAYNVIPSTDKKLYVDPLAGHGWTTEYRAAVNAFLKEKLVK